MVSINDTDPKFFPTVFLFFPTFTVQLSSNEQESAQQVNFDPRFEIQSRYNPKYKIQANLHDHHHHRPQIYLRNNHQPLNLPKTNNQPLNQQPRNLHNLNLNQQPRNLPNLNFNQPTKSQSQSQPRSLPNLNLNQPTPTTTTADDLHQWIDLEPELDLKLFPDQPQVISRVIYFISTLFH